MKGKQTNLRTLWTINTLLDGEEKTQTEIVKELKKIGKNNYSEDSEEATQLVKTSKSIESPIIKHLTEQKIINVELKDFYSSNLKANYCTIPLNLETFIKS